MAGRLHGMNVTPQATTTAAPTALTANATKPGSISLRWAQSTTPGVTQNRPIGNGVYATGKRDRIMTALNSPYKFCEPGSASPRYRIWR
jgi:hypothetical protein